MNHKIRVQRMLFHPEIYKKLKICDIYFTQMSRLRKTHVETIFFLIGRNEKRWWISNSLQLKINFEFDKNSFLLAICITSIYSIFLDSNLDFLWWQNQAKFRLKLIFYLKFGNESFRPLIFLSIERIWIQTLFFENN